MLARLLGNDAAAVQCTYFQKSAQANWLVPVHQDLSVPVRERVSHPALDGWSIKEGVVLVQPPIAVLERLLVMRPLLLHASSQAQGTGRRRVLHGLFGPRTLPFGLQWAAMR